MAPAGQAADPDVRPQPVDQPVGAATRVGAPEAEDIADEQLEDGTFRHGRQGSRGRSAAVRAGGPAGGQMRGSACTGTRRRSLAASW